MARWRAFRRIYGPIGQRRDDYLAALIAQTVRNSSFSTQAASIDDFIPTWDEHELDEQGVDDGDGS